MLISTIEELLFHILRARSCKDIRDILQAIGDHADVGLNTPFGPHSFRWHPFGNNPSNISTIGLATKPGRSLTERLTNAMDALLESRAHGISNLPNSAREAAMSWFGRPCSGPDEGLFKWKDQSDIARRICVLLLPGEEEGRPTIDVYDDGIGISPQNFSSTILSLQAGNKITKKYLIGAFGQGGASTLAFCEYAVILSRSNDSSPRVGFTVIRVLRLDQSYKEDTYAYLSLEGENGRPTVPSSAADTILPLYEPVVGLALPTLRSGSLVRHFGYRLAKHSQSLGPAPGNLYHYLHCSAFDPLLPFRLIDLRAASNEKDELVTGSRNRLMKLSAESPPTGGAPHAGSEVKHHRTMEFVVPHGSSDPCIGIEYWVVLNYKRIKKGGKEELILRSKSNELYVDPGFPIIGTLNGQNQGEQTGWLLRDMGLGMTAGHMVVHIDCTRADSRVRRELFSTNREGFKEGPVLDGILAELRRMLQEDETLYEIERELTERLTKKEAQSTRDEVKKQVTKMLRDAGLQVQEPGPTSTAGEGEEDTTRRKRNWRRPVRPDPLPTLVFPNVTRFEIVTPREGMKLPLNETEYVLVETDADSEFDRRGLVTIRSEPKALEVALKSPLKGGRVRWRMRASDTAKVGENGSIIVTLTRPDGTQLTDSIGYELLAATREKAKQQKGIVPPFEIVGINPEDDAQQWEIVWPELPLDSAADELATVSYKPMKSGGGITVFYSEVFGPYKEHVEQLKTSRPQLAELFTVNYEVWIGYHAILQERENVADLSGGDGEKLASLFQKDRDRVARMQVRQALRIAELMHVAATQTSRSEP